MADADLALVNDNFLLATKNGIILKNQLDSTHKEENINSLNKQARIQNLELNNQKLEVTRKNIIITVIIVLAMMGFLLGYSFNRRYKLQQQTKLQQEILKHQDLATKAIIAAEETERKRIATDLHDGVGQLMSAAKMNLSAIESDLNFTSVAQKNAYDKAMALVDEGCKEVRAVSHNMMPNALLRAGLASAVREFLDNLNSQVIKINLYADGLNERIDSNTETILYRVIQECVNNVLKHAKASLLDISIIKEAENISVTIEDNGIGFDKNSLKNGTGIGLKNIETRMAFLKGSVEWESQPGKGTLVVLHVVC
ncbi:MAG: sensor histidine kinase [Ferruginibacter sp.]|nr:sensor histidine kinase [Ferruginibacter sp.]